MSVVARELTFKLIELLPKTKRLFDMNLRNNHYTTELVRKLIEDSSILKLNNEEIQICCELFNKKPMTMRDFCKWVVDEFELDGVCVTMGEEGCAIFLDGEYLETLGYPVEAVDYVGAGDAFAAGLLHGLYRNWKLDKICNFANRLGALNISSKGAIPKRSVEEDVK